MKLVLQGKREFCLFCYNAILKDRVLFKKTQSSIETDVTVVKKHDFSKSVCKIKAKKKRKLMVL